MSEIVLDVLALTRRFGPCAGGDPDPGWHSSGNIRRCLGPGNRRSHERNGPVQFNVTLGAIGTAVGIGASISQVIAGSIVHRFGSNTGCLFLAAVALATFGILYFCMPETRDKRPSNPTL